MKVTITVLVENTVRRRGLLAEHGLAYWIEFGDRHILFDTGQGMVLEHNARTLSIDLSTVDDLILSHGHYDHSGGISAVHQLKPNVRVFAHPGCTAAKFRQTESDVVLDVGVSGDTNSFLRDIDRHGAWQKTEKVTEVHTGFFVTGPIPRRNHFEDVGGRFFLDRECCREDAIVDDQAVYFDTQDGIVVLLGCAHAGVINTIDFIKQQLPDRPILAVLGGMHLLNASDDRLQQTIDRLAELDVQQYGVGHCTGQRAIARLRKAFPNRLLDFQVGSELTFVL
ncbi:MBL fold metallo-hydrolase [Crateriforma conspicua]|uniref:ComEC family competence protein n=1 Tax=Crateriforma conspicua TaxID=2527996 RepID=A0A5C6FN75_9PLAN|nr:MBL fold metallo-hydrolase [Crateriforma conspicua]TWU64587.1 ComEC family competence protein [Crateriforma conspicua]